MLLFSSCATLNSKKNLGNNFNNMEDVTRIISNKIIRTVNTLRDTLVYPRSTLPEGKWKTVSQRDWTSGFFPGILWYLYEMTNDVFYKKLAEKWTAGLTEIQNYSGSHDIGFIIFCSFGNGYRITKNEEYKKVILQGANTLMKRYNPKVGVIRSWDHSRNRWQYPVIIDNMMNLELLLWASRNGGSQQMYDIAFQHAEKTMLNHFRSDGSTYHVLSYDTTNGNVISKGTHQGYSDESCWSRGQAWAIYGFTMAFRYTKDSRFLETAQKAANYFINNLPPDKIPSWDFSVNNLSNEPHDASAAAIASSALFELSSFISDLALKEKYYFAAVSILKSLCTEQYLTNDTSSLGILNHSVGNKPDNSEVDVSLIYGDYYFIEALIRYHNYEKYYAEEEIIY